MSNGFKFTIDNGKQAGEVFDLFEGIHTIGRDSKARFVVKEETISREHVRLTVKPGGVLVEDLGSANGTLLNGQPLKKAAKLRPGDKLLLGENISLTFGFAGDATMFSTDKTYVSSAPPSNPILWNLVVQSGPQAGQVFPLAAGEHTVGRDAGIELNDHTVSKKHLRLLVQPNSVGVQDLGSTNGTFINGQKVSQTAPQPLKPGDVLQVGTAAVLALQSLSSRTAPLPVAAQPQRRGYGWIAVALILVLLLLGSGIWLVLRMGNQRQVEPTQVVDAGTEGTPTAIEAIVTSVPAAEMNFTVDRNRIQLGKCALLRWEVDNIKEVRLNGEVVAATSETQVCPQEASSTYRLTALTLDGEIEEATVNLSVLPTPTPLPGLDAAFTSALTSIAYGDCTTLTWQVDNAQSVRLDGEQVGAQGSQEVCPQEPATTYRLLIGTLEGEIVEQTVVVRVNPTPTSTAPPTATPQPSSTPASTTTPVPTATPRPQSINPVVNQFVADSYALNQGDCTLLHWSVSYAQQVTLDGLAVANQGNQQVCPTTSKNSYNLLAVGGGAQAQASVIIAVSSGGSTGGATPSTGSNAIYVLSLGGQHRYEQPWGGDRGDPCEAFRTGNFDDEHPNFRGFNAEFLLTNNSSAKVSDDWGEGMRFFTASGGEVKACYYGYGGAGPVAGGTTSLTFFTVVPQGDYVQVAELKIGSQTTRLCLDGNGGTRAC